MLKDFRSDWLGALLYKQEQVFYNLIWFCWGLLRVFEEDDYAVERLGFFG